MAAPRIDFGTVEVLSFDCYGTLIDWERGILDALHEALGDRDVADDALLESYATQEAQLEAGPWRPYREILGTALAAVCREFGHEPTPDQMARFGSSVVRWPAFPDSAAALARLAERFELGVLTNCDDDLFAASAKLLGGHFSWVVTAESVRSYKPSTAHFEAAIARLGDRRASWVHVAQSLFHDHAPAQELGILSVWINRRHGRIGRGATPAAAAQPDLEVPDMATFAQVALGSD